MAELSNFFGKRIVRLERDRLDPLQHPISGTTPQMEDTMFETLMKFGGYRVDYMQSNRFGTPAAVGLYVLGDLPTNQAYSREAKHHLFSALFLLRDQHESENLVAIYLDVNTSMETSRPAYQQMKRDMKAGLFRWLCVPSICDLIGDDRMYSDFWNFYRELEWCEIISTENGQLDSVMFTDLTNCPMVSRI